MADNIQLGEGTSGKYAKTKEVSAGVHVSCTELVNSSGVEIAPLTDTQLRASAVPVSLASVPSHNVTNAGTFPVQAGISQNANRVQGKVDNADCTTARTVLSAIASNYVYITSVLISVAVAGQYWLEDDTTQITCKMTLAANGGAVPMFPEGTAWKTNTVNKPINIKSSVAGNVGVMLTGYQSTT
jgi:hypothetical protein